MADLMNFDAFKTMMAAAGMDLEETEYAKMAAASGTVDLNSIPSSIEVKFVEYQAKAAKSPSLYVEVLENRPELDRPVKLCFQRVSSLKTKIAGLENERRQLDLLAEALPNVVAKILNGDPNLPDGWVIHEEDDKGFAATKA